MIISIIVRKSIILQCKFKYLYEYNTTNQVFRVYLSHFKTGHPILLSASARNEYFILS